MVCATDCCTSAHHIWAELEKNVHIDITIVNASSVVLMFRTVFVICILYSAAAHHSSSSSSFIVIVIRHRHRHPHSFCKCVRVCSSYSSDSSVLALFSCTLFVSERIIMEANSSALAPGGSAAAAVAKGYKALGITYAKTLPTNRITPRTGSPAPETGSTGSAQETGSALGKHQTGTAPTKSGSALAPDPGSALDGPQMDAAWLHAKRRRQLQRGSSIDDQDADELQHKMRQVLLPAEKIRTLEGFEELAAEHLGAFQQLLGPFGRSIVPKRTLRIGTACTGSAADAISMSAIEHAFSRRFGRGSYKHEYIFNCEKANTKRKWIKALHGMMMKKSASGLDNSTAAKTASGLGPCLFDDIGDLGEPQCKCHTHHTIQYRKRTLTGTCPVKPIDVLFCSTSCKDLSKMNANKESNSTILDGKDTPGQSVQTFNGLCRLLAARRPDFLFFENVEDMADEKEKTGTSDLDIAKQRFNALGYEVQVIICNSLVFGLPQSRYRLFIVAINGKDPKTIELSERSISEVFASFSALLKVCERKAECASKFLLADDDPHVLQELQRAEEEARCRKDTGYAFEKPMEVAKKLDIP